MPGFSQSYNRYAYVLNDPLSRADPSGFFGIDGDLIGIEITGININFGGIGFNVFLSFSQGIADAFIRARIEELTQEAIRALLDGLVVSGDGVDSGNQSAAMPPSGAGSSSGANDNSSAEPDDMGDEPAQEEGDAGSGDAQQGPAENSGPVIRLPVVDMVCEICPG